MQLDSIEIKPDTYTCIDTRHHKLNAVPYTGVKDISSSDPSVKKYSIYGKVIDVTTGDPIPYAIIKLLYQREELHYTTTDQFGKYRFPSFINNYYNLVVSKNGYDLQSYTFVPGRDEDKDFNFSLSKTLYQNQSSLTEYSTPSLDYTQYGQVFKKRYPTILTLNFKVFSYRMKKRKFRAISCPSFGGESYADNEGSSKRMGLYQLHL